MDPSGKNIHAGHRQRVREKVLSSGVDDMADHEILEFLLFYVIPKRDVNPLAHRLLDTFGSLSRALSATTEEILAVDGAGPAVARMLNAFSAVVDACLEEAEEPPGAKITPESAVITARTHFIHPTRQELALLCADEASALRNCVVSDWDALLPPGGARWLLEAAMDNNARHITLVWKRQGRVRQLVKREIDDLNHLLKLLHAAEVCLDEMILLYRDGQISLRKTGMLQDIPLTGAPRERP
ncbi:MAG: hypothetical protein IKO07_11645 [Clostridia bacterium]|nr:hypothetical protein [Clostridia bacterium]